MSTMPSCNVGKTERAVRIIVAVIAIFLGFYISPWFYAITVIALLTAMFSFCPITHALGINTCKEKAKKK